MRCMSGWLIGFPRRLVITCTWRVMFQLETSSWLIGNFNGCWHAQPIKGQFWRESRRGWSELHHTWKHDQAWEATRAVIIMEGEHMNEPVHWKNKALNNKQRHAVMMEHRRGGTYISNQVRMHACHLTSKHCIYFLLVAGKILVSLARLGTKKESLTWWTIKNHGFDPGTGGRWDKP